MSLSDDISLTIKVGTLSILLGGLYTSYTGVDVRAIPESVYIELAEKLVPYLEKWDYDKISFEEWIRTSLIIAPKDMFNETELNEYQRAEIYFERKLGNMIMIICGEMIK